jgi:hypothetical protein
MAKVGGEVDARCGKCEMVLAHTVIAMQGGQPVKVECNTCHAVHRFRPGAGAAAKRPPSRPAAAQKKAPLSFDQMLARRSAAGTRRYSPRETFAAEEVIEHPAFGPGLVSAVRDGGKIDVTFRTAVKTLVHGKSGA